MTTNDQTIPADKVRGIINEMNLSMKEPAEGSFSEGYDDATGNWKRHLESLLPTPPLPTLADMTDDERAACQWMQADTETWGRVVIIVPDLSDGRAALLDIWGDVFYEDHASVTPCPDLPRMEWPGTEKPAPALPDGWRLAYHRKYGRVVVTTENPDDDGLLAFVHRADDLHRQHSHDWCKPDQLTYVDQEDDTPTGPGHLAVGAVIESADDPRLAALPVGSILLDRDEEVTTKLRGDWAGPGYIPIAGDGTEYGPWTVLHIPKEADQ